MKLLTTLFTLFIAIFSACSAPHVAPVTIEHQQANISYLRDVKPILDKRCVSCHSCYNAPCQSKFSSFEGVNRGGSKIEVYNATRITAIDPTRLFTDAQTTREWREKGFFSLTQSSESNATANDSIMMHLLHSKKTNPQVIGDYSPEHDTLSCPKDKKELEVYLNDKPYHGMPYGFPALSDKEYITLSSWLTQGAFGPTKQEQIALRTPSKETAKQIQKWEAFLNKKGAKHQMTARYLYEHLYLAHINFSSANDTQEPEFYELIRSYTPSPKEPQTIATLRPFDDPGVEKFYYRFRKIHATIVHKTHMVFKLNDSQLKRFHEIFITPKWDEEPHVVSYDLQTSSNPFIAFRQIPPRSRYQFLLDNSHYIIMTFIRGPVCRGQMALNAIQDQFWVMFKDPDADLGVQYPEFLNAQVKNLSLPIYNVDEKLYRVFSDKYRDKYEEYIQAKKEISNRKYPRGYTLDSIWSGEKADDAPVLTVFRHFDSASVHKGTLGSLPRTLWVMDYAQFERLYYTLVAGYDVYGNVSHQTNIRRYMDFLRIEGELNFTEYMPKDVRFEMLKSWYINDSKVDKSKYLDLDKVPTSVTFKSEYPKYEFMKKLITQRFLKSTQIEFDPVNFIAPDEALPQMPKKITNKKEMLQAFRTLTLPGTGFIRSMTDSGANNMLLRVDLDDGSHVVKNLVIERWHDNVNSLFNGEEVLDPNKDNIDILDANIGSYPNVFIVVKQKDFYEFVHLLRDMKGTTKEYKRLQEFFISRSNPKFWETFDWFSEYFYKIDPLNAGLYDLNRYARTPWGEY